MNTVELCKKLKEACWLICVYLNGEMISSGTAVSISGGQLLTAAHVVTGRTPIRSEDLSDPGQVVFAVRMDAGPIPCAIGICGVSLAHEWLAQPLELDLALLRPIGYRPASCLSLRESPVLLGEPVLTAGFSDEVTEAFQVLSRIEWGRLNVPDSARVQFTGSPNMEAFRRPLVIKSGMVGCVQGLRLEDRNRGIRVDGEFMYIDNALHGGASGGPVLDNQARIAGIVTQRAITEVPFRDTPELRVPSGSSLAISPRVLFQYRRQTKRGAG